MLFRGSGWTLENVEARTRRIAEIYKQCNIKINKAALIEVDAPNGWIDVDYSVEKKDFKLSSMTPSKERPILYYVRSSLEKQMSYAWITSDEVPLSLKNTAWLTMEINGQRQRDFYHPSYNSDAHEIAHILGNCGHVKDTSKNLLSDKTELLNDEITSKQCEEMKNSPLVIKNLN